MAVQQNQRQQNILKVKKRCESSMTKVNPKNVEITVPSKERDSSSVSSMSDSVPRKKNQKQ